MAGLALVWVRAGPAATPATKPSLRQTLGFCKLGALVEHSRVMDYQSAMHVQIEQEKTFRPHSSRRFPADYGAGIPRVSSWPPS